MRKEGLRARGVRGEGTGHLGPSLAPPARVVAPHGQLLALLLQPSILLVRRFPGSVCLPLQWQCSTCMCTLLLCLRLLRLHLLPLLSCFLHAKSHALRWRLPVCWQQRRQLILHAL